MKATFYLLLSLYMNIGFAQTSTEKFAGTYTLPKDFHPFYDEYLLILHEDFSFEVKSTYFLPHDRKGTAVTCGTWRKEGKYIHLKSSINPQGYPIRVEESYDPEFEKLKFEYVLGPRTIKAGLSPALSFDGDSAKEHISVTVSMDKSGIKSYPVWIEPRPFQAFELVHKVGRPETYWRSAPYQVQDSLSNHFIIHSTQTGCHYPGNYYFWEDEIFQIRGNNLEWVRMRENKPYFDKAFILKKYSSRKKQEE